MHTESPYVPLELLASQILSRLPVGSLLRFRCVCKAWRDTIDGDESFHREHLHFQKTSLLLAPQVRHYMNVYWGRSITGLYRWEPWSQDAVTRVPDMAGDDHTLRAGEATHDLAHCDGLVLLPSEATLRVLNPATRGILRLPWSHGIKVPFGGLNHLPSHQAFGLGQDTRSKAYKVARFFYRSIYKLARGYQYTLEMEIFTIGTDQQWRDVKKPPPYPIKPARTATFCKGSLYWTVETLLLCDRTSMPGFVRFNLEDESFSVVPAPNWFNSLKSFAVPRLAELQGQLCIAHSRHTIMSIEIWMCSSLDDNTPPWDRRFVIPMFNLHVSPKAIFDDKIVCHLGTDSLLRYNFRTGERVVLDMRKMYDPKHGNRDNGYVAGTIYENIPSAVYAFDVIPYVPSLVNV
ncbi:hypothetical protein QYE76_026959 [Lolium multiflorum]|uniref:F-box domain-containing protein n=1 Tax=Lolium multiflorum TaxID=4521 RepID=A0AAD8QJW6_LOLMU|nr:hypothetical protein QYE76_026959 [Lolium multiflorum]